MTDITEVTGEVAYKATQENGDIMLIFKINKGVEDLISYRKISIDVVWWSESGLKVPNQAIMEENGLKYVIRNRVGYKDKILIKILKQNENYSIIENYTAKELQDLGYNKSEISEMKRISIYDELTIEKEK